MKRSLRLLTYLAKAAHGEHNDLQSAQRYRVPQRFSPCCSSCRTCHPLVDTSAPNADLKPPSTFGSHSTAANVNACTLCDTDLVLQKMCLYRVRPRSVLAQDGLDCPTASNLSLRGCRVISTLSSWLMPSFPSLVRTTAARASNVSFLLLVLLFARFPSIHPLTPRVAEIDELKQLKRTA